MRWLMYTNKKLVYLFSIITIFLLIGTGYAFLTAELSIGGGGSVNKYYLCKRATTLHTETCALASGGYYCNNSHSAGETITYGSTGTSGQLNTGDAFTCDVNGDGAYNENTERFYYVSDYFDGDTRTFDSNYATLVYYNNTNSSGRPDNQASTKQSWDNAANYDTDSGTAAPYLPTSSFWKNAKLYKATRVIKAHHPSAGTYIEARRETSTNYPTRLLTIEEIENGCNPSVTFPYSSDPNKILYANCEFLFENTKYANYQSSTLSPGYVLESGYFQDASTFKGTILDYNGFIQSINTATESYGVRPAIDVAKSSIEY